MLNAVNPINTGIRSIFITFDMCIYYLLRFIYELFFNIATFNLIDREMIFKIFSRVQLVIGIFMLFQLVMIVIKGIVNPDSFTDAKTGGAGAIIMRIVVSLALLALIVPINIPSPKNDYERQINNNGILFGTLYSLQYRILSNNTIGRLILGDDSTNYTSNNANANSLTRFANKFTATIIKIFYVPITDDNGEYVCNDNLNDIYRKRIYEDDDTEPFLLIAGGTNTCTTIPVVDYDVHGTGLGLLPGERYSMSMSFIISTLAGGALVVLLIMMTFEVAKRVFQLAALQLLAPIPIISYMDPKGSKDSAFSSWLKLLGTTYLELFIRLAVIFFAFGVINSFIDRFNMFGSLEDVAGAAVSGIDTIIKTNDPRAASSLVQWTFIIMCIALFIFAKDAPKFFKQMLGIKDNGNGFFSAFGTALGFGVSAISAAGGFASYRDAARDATAARIKKQNPGITDEEAKRRAGIGFGNRAKQAFSGLFGAGTSVAAGVAAASESKGNGLAKMMASYNASKVHNNRRRSFGEDGGTTGGAVKSFFSSMVHGESPHDSRERRLKAETQHIKDEQTALKNEQNKLKLQKEVRDADEAVVKRFSSKAFDSHKTEAKVKYTPMDAFGRVMTNAAGNPMTINIEGNGRAFQSRYVAAKDSGDGVITEYQKQGPNNSLITIDKSQYDALSDVEKADYREARYFEFGNGKVYMSSATSVLEDMKKYDGYDYHNKSVLAADAVDFIINRRGLANDDATREQVINEVDRLDKNGSLVQELINLGMNATTADNYKNVIADSDIIGHRRAHRENMINLHILRDGMDRATAEAQPDIVMSRDAGQVKGNLGNMNLSIERREAELNRDAQRLSERERAVAEEQRSYEAQKDKTEAEWFSKGSGK